LRAAIALDADFPLFEELVVFQGHVVTIRSYETGRFAGDRELIRREEEEFTRLLAFVEALKLDTEIRSFLFHFMKLDLRFSMFFLLPDKSAERFEMPSFLLLGFGEIGPEFVSFSEMVIISLVFFLGVVDAWMITGGI